MLLDWPEDEYESMSDVLKIVPQDKRLNLKFCNKRPFNLD